jgi:hypothetical protein
MNIPSERRIDNINPNLFRLAAALIMFVSTVLGAGALRAQQRLPTIPPDQYTADQKKAAEEFLVMAIWRRGLNLAAKRRGSQ